MNTIESSIKMRPALKTVKPQVFNKQSRIEDLQTRTAGAGERLDGTEKNVLKSRKVTFNIDTRGHARAPEICLCDAIVERTQGTSPLIACDQCNSWHTLRCLAMKSDQVSTGQSKCLPCRKVALFKDLSSRIAASKLPRSEQLQAVCNKLRVPLPQNSTCSDIIVRLSYFLIGAPRMRSMMCSGSCLVSDLARLAAGPQGLQSGRAAQEALLKSLTLGELRTTSKMMNLKRSGTKDQLAIRLLCCLRNEPSEAYEAALKEKNISTTQKQPKKEDKLQRSITSKLKKFTVTELRTECESSGLSKQGLKAELVDRLSEHLLSNVLSDGPDAGKHPEGCSCDVCDLELASLIRTFDDAMISDKQ